MSTTSTGRAAENSAAKYLSEKGYEILEQNWRTRWCEIDIIAKKNNRIYFVEVKYRNSDSWGSGLDYITKKKQKQMAFAAEFWVSNNNWKNEYCLSAIEVTGLDYKITAFLRDL